MNGASKFLVDCFQLLKHLSWLGSFAHIWLNIEKGWTCQNALNWPSLKHHFHQGTMWTTFRNSKPMRPLAVHFLLVSLSCSLVSGFFDHTSTANEMRLIMGFNGYFGGLSIIYHRWGGHELCRGRVELPWAELYCCTSWWKNKKNLIRPVTILNTDCKPSTYEAGPIVSVIFPSFSRSPCATA